MFAFCSHVCPKQTYWTKAIVEHPRGGDCAQDGPWQLDGNVNADTPFYNLDFLSQVFDLIGGG
jgi:hypothetical protein